METNAEGTDSLIIHHHDWDGMVAAWCATKALGDKVKLLPVDYGDPLPEVDGKEVYILDFSYPEHTMRNFIARAKKVILLDHHKSARGMLANLTDGESIIFDVSVSGGHLAHDFFIGKKDPPPIVKYTEDMDMWTWTQPESHYIIAAIDMYPLSLESCDTLNNLLSGKKSFKVLVDQGNVVLKYQDRLIEESITHASSLQFDEHEVLAANVSTTSIISETANRLSKDRPFGVSFYYSKGRWFFSLRSTGDVDVSEIARKHGGGGHQHSAGFVSDVFPPVPVKE